MSDIGNPITAIESEAWVEAAARTMCREAGGDPDALNRSGFMMWTYYQEDALAAIRALAPLIIERCAEVATPKYDAPCGCTSCCCGKLDDAENQAAWREATHITARIRALIQKEADHE